MDIDLRKTPEGKLWMAVVKQAYEDIQTAIIYYGPVDSWIVNREAPRWALSSADWVSAGRDDPGGFSWVCGILDIDPERAAKNMFFRAPEWKPKKKNKGVSAE